MKCHVVYCQEKQLPPGNVNGPVGVPLPFCGTHSNELLSAPEWMRVLYIWQNNLPPDNANCAVADFARRVHSTHENYKETK